MVFLFGCVDDGNGIDDLNYYYCETTEDCASATCCHPTEAINKDYAPNCSEAICTLSCEGPLDCGVGYIDCVNYKCEIVQNEDYN